MKAIFCLLLCLILSGCDNLTSTTPKKNPFGHVVKRPVPVHRFVQNTYNPDIAFDTQTGQICKTWDWQSANPAKANADGTQRQRVSGEFSPTCASIYLSSPSQIAEVEEESK